VHRIGRNAPGYRKLLAGQVRVGAVRRAHPCNRPGAVMLNHDDILARLLDFQRIVRDTVIRSRAQAGLSNVNRDSAADTIYQIDTLVEPLLEDFCREWGKTTPLVLVAEGLENERGEEGSKVFPEGARDTDCPIRLIVDPI